MAAERVENVMALICLATGIPAHHQRLSRFSPEGPWNLVVCPRACPATPVSVDDLVDISERFDNDEEHPEGLMAVWFLLAGDYDYCPDDQPPPADITFQEALDLAVPFVERFCCDAAGAPQVEWPDMDGQEDISAVMLRILAGLYFVADQAR